MRRGTRRNHNPLRIRQTHSEEWGYGWLTQTIEVLLRRGHGPQIKRK
jgi:hypothetical protein